MDPRVRKLAILLKDPEAAEALVAAGLDNPGKIRKASENAITAAVGSGKKDKVRGKFPKVK